MKKVTSIFLVCVMFFSMLPVSGLAKEVESSSLGTTEGMNPSEEQATFSQESEYAKLLKESSKVDRFIVKPKADVAMNAMMTLGGEEVTTQEILDTVPNQTIPYVVVTLEEKMAPEEFMSLVADQVDFIQPDYELELSAISYNELERPIEANKIPATVFDNEANLSATHEFSSGLGATIALIDTGVDIAHPDLVGHFVDGWNFTNNSSIAEAFGTTWGEAHGTHIAGIIANVAPDAKIMPLQVFEAGKAYTSDIVAAIQYAEAHGAQIVNCSWGSTTDNPVLYEAIKNSEMFFVAAAGNSRTNLNEKPVYPACYKFDNVISVASVNVDGGMSYFSNYGKAVDIAAWGRDVISTIPGGGYEKMQGTSIAAGFVAGSAALLKTLGISTLEIKTILKSSADKLNILNNKTDDGNILNYYNAVNKTAGQEIIVTTAVDDFDVFAEESEDWNLYASGLGIGVLGVSAGLGHFAMVTEDGAVWTWGSNDHYEQGNNYQYVYPHRVPGITDAKYVYAGYGYTMAVKNDGTVWAWGQNMTGLFGNGTVSNAVQTPVQCGITNVKAIAGNSDCVLFLKNNGTVWFAGANQGLRGDGSSNSTYYRTPVQITELTGIKEIDVSLIYACALNENGDVYLWGKPTGSSTIKPTIHLTGVETIACGMNCMVASKGNALYGFGTACKSYSNPIPLLIEENGLEIKSVTAGKGYVLTTLKDGTVKGFGTNSLSQLGNATLQNVSYANWSDVVTSTDPRFQEIFTGVSYVEASEYANIAFMDNGTVYTWGGNIYGQLGSNIWTSSTQYKANCPSQQYGFGPNEIKASQTCYLYGPSDLSKDMVAQLLPLTDDVSMINGNRVEIPINWDIATYQVTYNGKYYYANISGGYDLTNVAGVSNPKRLQHRASIQMLDISRIKEIETLEPVYVQYNTTSDQIELPNSIKVTLGNSNTSIRYQDFTISKNVNWDLSTYDPQNYSSVQLITGKLQLPTTGYSNPDKLVAKANIQVQTYIEQIPEIQIETSYGAPIDTILPNTVSVLLLDDKAEELPVIWDTSSFDGTLTEQTQILTGDITLPNGILNQNELKATAKIIIRPEPLVIKAITPRSLEARQNVLLGPIDKEHGSGEPPTTEILPDTVWVELSNGERQELPVIWDVTGYDPMLPEVQTFFGEVQIEAETEITNPDRLQAELYIDVAPRTYWVFSDDFYFPSVSIEVLLGTNIAELNDILIQTGQKEVSIIAWESEGSDVLNIFCDINIEEGPNSSYQMNIPGEYELMATLPDNILVDAAVNELPITVTVLPPSSVVKAEAYMSTRQSVDKKNIENIVKQADVTMENGWTIPVDVEWNWANFDKDSEADQYLLGTLKNVPAPVKLEEEQEIKATLIVDVIPTQYNVTEIVNNSYTGDSGLTLSELHTLLQPTVTLEITSIDENDSFVTEYDVPVTFDENDINFNSKEAGKYTLSVSPAEGFILPENITWPSTIESALTITTNKIDIIEVEPLYAVTSEGTPFNEIELPSQATVTLSCKGADEKNKKAVIDIDWGLGEGYTPNPDSWDDDGTVTFEILGSLVGCEKYINNAEEMPVTVQITMLPAPNLIAITPRILPSSGALEVKLGATLEEIYAELDTHSVQLELEDYQGNIRTVEMSFLLRAEDNPEYNSSALGTYTLNLYLPLGNTIKNPGGLNAQLLVKTVKYSIYSVENIRMSASTGIPFDDLDMPTEVSVTRNDKVTEKLDVTWNGQNYNSDKIGTQIIQGTLVTPLPIHLENPNNRQPRILLTLSAPNTQTLSLTPISKEQMVIMLTDNLNNESELMVGLIEYCFWAELLHEDGTVSIEQISIFEELEP
ncbi:MAG: S8 family serine peptidase [Oscillospiraceae bacterium]|jgi:alpha-tubulin suppressor-like RCC1 family protein|nr:S8 family serine peptidase [Oscillospiraceae bacterium]